MFKHTLFGIVIAYNLKNTEGEEVLWSSHDRDVELVVRLILLVVTIIIV